MRGFRQPDQKLLAAVARNPIAVGANEFLRPGGELLQYIIACGMPALIVDLLEMIEIAHEHGQRIGVTAATPELARQLLHQVASTVSTAQPIRKPNHSTALITPPHPF